MAKWYPIWGYENYYEISNTGKVRSVDRYDNRGRFRKGKLIKLRRIDDEYRQGVFVRLTRGGNARDLDIAYIIMRSIPEEEKEAVRKIIYAHQSDFKSADEEI